MRRPTISIPVTFAALLIGCGATLSTVLDDVDAALNASCGALTMLPNEVAVCAGIKGAEEIANLVDQFITSRATTSPTLAAALSAHKLRAGASGTSRKEKIHGLPVYAPAEVAVVLNEPKENAALRAFVLAGLTAKSIDAGGQ
jgi:hypothetical protein